MKPTILLNIHLHHPNDFIDARHRARQIAAELTFNIQDQTRIGTAVSEVAREISQEPLNGKLELAINSLHKTLVMTFTYRTNNHNLPSIQTSGIEAVKKIVENFSMRPHPDHGMIITMEMHLPPSTPSINPAFLNHLSESLLKNRPKNASEEIYHQNTEILNTLKLLQQANDELETRVQERTQQLSKEILAKSHIEKSLQETQERLELALTSAHVGTWSWNIDDQTIFWDNHMYPLFNRENDPPLKLTWEHWLHYVYPADHDKLKAAFDKALYKDYPLEVEFRVGLSKNTLKYISLRGQVYFNAQHVPQRIAGICWDMTERKRDEEQLQAYQRQIAQATRAHSIGEMASTIAHELNQPLTAISAYARGCLIRLEKGAIHSVDLIHPLKELSHQAERAGEILHRIKNFVRQGSIEPEIISLEKVIQECIKLIHYELPHMEIYIHYEPAKHLPSVLADKIKIEQVLLNLLRNSMEALQEAKQSHPTIWIKTQLHPSHNTVIVRIMDNGPGFSPSVKKSLFEPYFTTKSQGMGIGLSICKTLIEAHRGTLQAHTTAEGASFEFSLPLS